MIRETGKALDARIGKEVLHLGNGTPIPAYSTALEYAWQVVDAMRAKGYDFHFTVKHGGGTQVIFEEIKEATVICRGTASVHGSAAEAICIAALDAIEKTHGQ